MPTVAAIFDDSVGLERAVSRLQEAGLGDDVREVHEGGEADTIPEDTPHNPGFLPAAGAANLYGGASRTTPAAVDAPNTSYLGRLGDDAEPFRQSLEHGGKLVVLETDEVDRAVSILQRAGAQRVHQP